MSLLLKSSMLLLILIFGSSLVPALGGSPPAQKSQGRTEDVFVEPSLSEYMRNQSIDPMRLIVTFRSDVSWEQRAQILSSIEGVSIHRVFNIIPGVSITASPSFIEKAKESKYVEGIWIDHRVKALSNSESIAYSYRASATSNYDMQLINAPALWKLGVDGSGCVIAMLDTGINWNHESLDDLDDDPATDDPKVIAKVSFVPGTVSGFDDDRHGTHTAGIAAGTGGPSHTYMGVAPQAQLLAVKVLTEDRWGLESWVIAGIEWSVKHGADVISISLGGTGYPNDPLSRASNAAVEAGVVVVGSAGNHPGYYSISYASPAQATKVITVGASTREDSVARFSSGGPNPYDFRGDPDVVAPGVRVMSADARNQTNYISMSGTSMATPHVSGSAALLLEAFPDSTPSLISSALMASAVDLGFDSYRQGSGRIDVYKAYNLILEWVNRTTGVEAAELP